MSDKRLARKTARHLVEMPGRAPSERVDASYGKRMRVTEGVVRVRSTGVAWVH